MIKYFLFLTLSYYSFAQDIPYNKANFKTSHNSYAGETPIIELITTHNFQAIEFDLHKKGWIKGAPSGDWFVFHHLLDRKSQVKHFSSALDILAKYNKENLNHNVLTVFLDMDGFNKDHSIKMFNQLLREKLGKAIFGPNDLKSKCNNSPLMKKAVQRCGWPYLSDLKGKIIFVIATGDLEEYVNSTETQVAFVASKPNKIIRDSVFMNSSFSDDEEWLQTIKDEGRVLRFYHLDEKEIPKAKELGVNFIAIDF